MAQEEGELDLSDESIYRSWATVTLRYVDEDRMGHVNHSVYASWFEASRVPMIERVVGDTPDLDTVLARITVDYLRETSFPGEVLIGMRLASIGRKSFRTVYGAFRDGECLATGECVNVFFDTVARRSAEPPAAVRRRLEAELQV